MRAVFLLRISVFIATATGCSGIKFFSPSGSGGQSSTGVAVAAPDCSMQGFSTVHFVDMGVGKSYQELHLFGTSQTDEQTGIPRLPPTDMGRKDVVIIRFWTGDFPIDAGAVEIFAGDELIGPQEISMTVSTEPCDWDGTSLSANHFGPWQSEAPDQMLKVGGQPYPGDTILPPNTWLYLILSRRDSSFTVPDHHGSWSDCDQTQGACDMLIEIGP